MAKREQRLVLRGGIEAKLDILAITFLVLGIVPALCIFILLFALPHFAPGSAIFYIWSAFSIFWGIVFYVVFKSASEAIRLLKKQNGLEYSGKISVPTQHYENACSNCGAYFDESQTVCYECDESFEDAREPNPT
jgi:hypothetical protein